jgi:putative pyruvate formate lyase activating enzyme
MMLWLQHKGCHNVNLVTPTHWVPQIMKALCLAVEKGFHLPLVFNSNGYDSQEALRLLEGVVDIYLPDMKYHSEAIAEKLSSASCYCAANKLAVKEMARQVPNYQVDEEGILIRGLIIRHLILPEDMAGSKEIFRFIATQLSPETHLSLMTQYFPAHQAVGDKVLGKRIGHIEYQMVKKAWEEAGLQQGWYQLPNFL